MQIDNKVPFDPGFSEFSVNVPDEAMLILDEISKLKQLHKKKYEFQKLEINLTPLIKNCAAIYLGCILWGSYLHNRYKADPKEISGNVIKEMSEDQRGNIDYDGEINLIIELINRLDRDSKYYLKKPGKISRDVISYLEAYREFCRLNKNFTELNCTDGIKLPETTAHFENYDEQKLDELKDLIENIINSKKIENLLEIGFYK